MEVPLKDPAAARSAPGVLLGGGLAFPDGTSSRPLSSSAGALVWRKYREIADPYGLKHTFFRQVLLPAGDLAARVPAEYIQHGIPIPDTSLGLHTASSGLVFVYGHQITSATVSNVLSVDTPEEAAYTALAAVVASGQYEPFDPSLLDQASREEWERSPTLFLRPDPSSDALLPTWRARIPTSERHARIALIDAASGALLEAFDPNPSDSCSPQTTTAMCGVSYPQLALPVRPGTDPNCSNGVKATTSTYFGTTYPFEAHWPKEQGNQGLHRHPAIQVYHGSDNDCTDDVPPNQPICWWYISDRSCQPQPYWYCPNDCTSDRYYGWGLMPIQALNNKPYYENLFGQNGSLGRQAGDAIWYSRLTFLTLNDDLGWPGYMGLQDIGFANPAVVEVQGNYYVDSSEFLFGDDTAGRANWVIIGHQLYAPMPLSACLDIIAHEWGHGVIKYSAISTYDTATRKQLHEGFADVIGHIVEWDNNPGNTPNGADWVFAKYCQTADRLREADSFHNGLCYYNGEYSGACPAGVDPHYGGHMLSVAFRLLALDTAHNTNPAGGPYANNYVRGQGMAKARKVFFNTLNYYVTQSTTWEGLPYLALRAAQSAYPSDVALQTNTVCAFQAIGYSTGPWIGCTGY